MENRTVKEYVFKCQEGEERENETEVFEVMMLDGSQNLMTGLKAQVGKSR